MDLTEILSKRSPADLWIQRRLKEGARRRVQSIEPVQTSCGYGMSIFEQKTSLHNGSVGMQFDWISCSRNVGVKRFLLLRRFASSIVPVF
jgi:hypothetical protein